jgi:carbon storage regulator CsrA
MLIVTRRDNEEIIIETSDGLIRVVVDRAKKHTARIGVDAPAVCKIWRKEIFDRKMEEETAKKAYKEGADVTF